jgi:hypothetical protein
MADHRGGGKFVRALSLSLLILAGAARVFAGPAGPEDPAASRLLEAARRGDAPSLAALLREGADANARDPGGRPALALAAATARPEAVLALLRGGARPDEADRGGWTALHHAVQAGDLATARAVLDGGASPDLASRDRGTPLDMAERAGREDIARLLRARGARGSGKSIGDTVCVRAWRGEGYCGEVTARDATRFEVRVLSIEGCTFSCAPRADCSGGRTVGPGCLGAGERLWVPGSCLTHTGVR